MPLGLQIVRAREFIRLDAHGHLDLEGSRAVLKALADACRKRRLESAMLDVRDMRTDLTPADLATLVRDFCDIGFTRHQRLALLHSSDEDYRAKLFALISHLRGWTVQAFDSFEGALDWLALCDETQAERAPFSGEQDVPIRGSQPADELPQTKKAC